MRKTNTYLLGNFRKQIIIPNEGNVEKRILTESWLMRKQMLILNEGKVRNQILKKSWVGEETILSECEKRDKINTCRFREMWENKYTCRLQGMWENNYLLIEVNVRKQILTKWKGMWEKKYLPNEGNMRKPKSKRTTWVILKLCIILLACGTSSWICRNPRFSI